MRGKDKEKCKVRRKREREGESKKEREKCLSRCEKNMFVLKLSMNHMTFRLKRSSEGQLLLTLILHT